MCSMARTCRSMRSSLRRPVPMRSSSTRIFSSSAVARVCCRARRLRWRFIPCSNLHRQVARVIATSLRGGGPLVTLALPDGGPGSRPTLWQRLWLNTPFDLRLDASGKTRAFPWLAATRTSTKKEIVHEGDAHPLQAFFGMPRRIRLVFKDNVERLACDLTGRVDDAVCTGFVATPWGANYGVWRHPATPYYKPKANSDDPALPVHAPDGRLGYRQWLGWSSKAKEKSQPRRS